MLPYIWLFGTVKIPMYGVMILLGVVTGLLVALRFPCKKEIARADIRFVSCYIGIGVFLGAKLLFLAVTIPQLLALPHPPALSWALVSQLVSSGFVFYGGLGGGLLGAYLYARQFRLPFLPLLESLIPSVPLIHAFGRIGCFCAGCCYGLPAPAPWGVRFAVGSAAPTNITVFPIQLVESTLNLGLFAALFAYSRKERANGRLLALYLCSYAFIRFMLEFFRGDTVRGAALGLSTSQWASLAAFIGGGILLLCTVRRGRLMRKTV